MNSESNDILLKKSHEYCREITRKQAGNFYYGLKLLPEPKRSAMYVLYAYMRLVDDIADAEDGRTTAQKIVDLEAWRKQTFAVLGINGGEEQQEALRRHILWPGFADLVMRYQIPSQVLEDMIAGQRQDLEPVTIKDFEELYQYCYRVASVVGLASICVFGYTREGIAGKSTETLAVNRGIAFQLTNILRDLKEDGMRAGNGRCYLPLDELAQFGVSGDDIAAGEAGVGFDELMKFQIARAEEYYEKSAPLEQAIDEDSRPTLRAMTAIYHGILGKIKENPRRVLKERVSLSMWAKLRIGWRAIRK